jgi:hypothetical protein
MKRWQQPGAVCGDASKRHEQREKESAAQKATRKPPLSVSCGGIVSDFWNSSLAWRMIKKLQGLLPCF